MSDLRINEASIRVLGWMMFLITLECQVYSLIVYYRHIVLFEINHEMSFFSNLQMKIRTCWASG